MSEKGGWGHHIIGNGELCICFDWLDFQMLLFPILEILLSHVCSTVPDCKPKAVGQGIAMRAKDEQKRIQ